ncbi:uncharacterized protein LOC110466573 [Mizuhopecten yessoensis]|uniref:MRH domain-containing protein n=1 Tax=Mizuhopecten yessoensis TaxID=6573 RepID=A0A210PNZ4_MIZYE|nr:uncharacterized protein LOC110466573 [Mizuhopecten yessoensis]OWF38202.1 hypothetical protein KP79_PYT19413 [Mizuhopecten yessoensis]
MASTLLLVFGSIGLSLAQIPITCERVSPCICKDQNGRFVDLRPLARQDGTPRYHDVPNFGGREPSKTVYSYNPCFGFSEGPAGSACKDVAVCQSSNGTSEFVDLGDQRSATFSHFDNGNLSVVYNSKDKRYQTIVSLYCSDGGTEREFYVQGDIGSGTTWLQLFTKYACPRNESDIDEFEFDHWITETMAGSQPETEPVFTTPPPPHVVTMTALPGPPPTSSPATVSLVVLLLLAILVCVTLILAVLVGSMMVRSARKILFRDSVVYQPVPTEPQAYYDKSFGIIL